jgi:hypothetical protein
MSSILLPGGYLAHPLLEFAVAVLRIKRRKFT